LVADLALLLHTTETSPHFTAAPSPRASRPPIAPWPRVKGPMARSTPQARARVHPRAPLRLPHARLALHLLPFAAPGL